MLNNLKTEAQKIRLAPEQKEAMRARIFASPADGLRPGGAPTPTPYIFMFSTRWSRALAGVMLCVVAGAGTASAAQSALPGDLLHPVKVRVTERVELALAREPEEQARTEAEFAARRVAEAQELAARGRLTAPMLARAERAFEAHAASALALAGAAPPTLEVPATALTVPSGAAKRASFAEGVQPQPASAIGEELTVSIEMQRLLLQGLKAQVGE